MSEKQIWNVSKCCVCGRYVHKGTGNIVPKPNYGIVMSHTYCKECKEKAMKDISTLAAEGLVKRTLRPEPVPPETCERIRKRTLDRYQHHQGGRRIVCLLSRCNALQIERTVLKS